MIVGDFAVDVMTCKKRMSCSLMLALTWRFNSSEFDVLVGRVLSFATVEFEARTDIAIATDFELHGRTM